MNVEEAIKALEEDKEFRLIMPSSNNNDGCVGAIDLALSILKEEIAYGVYTNKQFNEVEQFPNGIRFEEDVHIITRKIAKLLYYCNANYNDSIYILDKVRRDIGDYYSIKI